MEEPESQPKQVSDTENLQVGDTPQNSTESPYSLCTECTLNVHTDKILIGRRLMLTVCPVTWHERFYLVSKKPKLMLHYHCSSVCLRNYLLYFLRYQDEPDNYRSRFESEERGRGRERGRDRREKYRDSENGQSSGRQSASFRHSPVWVSWTTVG